MSVQSEGDYAEVLHNYYEAMRLELILIIEVIHYIIYVLFIPPQYPIVTPTFQHYILIMFF